MRDDELWRVHLQLKRAFVGLIRERARLRWMRGLTEPAQLLAAGTLLDPEALTIGFARRFATYKRATLIFHDPDRLLRMLDDPWRPLQIVFAGKAHPAMIRESISSAKSTSGRSTASSARASRSSTTTICTSPKRWWLAWTCG